MKLAIVLYIVALALALYIVGLLDTADAYARELKRVNPFSIHHTHRAERIAKEQAASAKLFEGRIWVPLRPYRAPYDVNVNINGGNQ